jgi:hypothetical protein
MNDNGILSRESKVKMMLWCLTLFYKTVILTSSEILTKWKIARSSTQLEMTIQLTTAEQCDWKKDKYLSSFSCQVLDQVAH